jgi:hypothetical protein
MRSMPRWLASASGASHKPLMKYFGASPVSSAAALGSAQRTTRIASLMLGVLTGCSAVGGGSVGLLFDDGGLVLGVDAPRADVVTGRDVATAASDSGVEGDVAFVSTDGGAPTAGDAVATTDVAPGCRATETCGNGLDDDCNGTPDDNCACVPGMTQRCYGGDPANAGRGVCSQGMTRCEGTGEFGRWTACEGWGRPGVEACGNAMDDDCDGMVDENCLCNPGATRACYSGDTATRGVGTCRPGNQLCVAREGGADWGPCEGEVLPAPDTCDGMDRDCDGNPNTGCACTEGTTRACYSASPATANVGLCRAGTETCVRNKMGRTAWGACAGEVTPTPDTCDGMDRDCDGNPNTGCACTLGATRGCYDGPTGTADRGICRAGTQRCETASTGVGRNRIRTSGEGWAAPRTCVGLPGRGIPDSTRPGLPRFASRPEQRPGHPLWGPAVTDSVSPPRGLS